MFKNSWEIEWVDLTNNTIIDILPSTFRNNIRLPNLDISGIKIKSTYPSTCNHKAELEWLDLERNSINDVDPSTFRNTCNNWLRK
jgi:hypothetical protein